MKRVCFSWCLVTGFWDGGVVSVLNKELEIDGSGRDHDCLPTEAKPRIRWALADASDDTSDQAGAMALLDESLIGQGREPLLVRG